MSLDKEAIEKIAQMAVATAKILPDTDYPAVLTPGDMVLSGMERFSAAPYAHSGVFRTTRIQSFLDYVREHAEPRTHIFIDDRKMVAEAAFDHYQSKGKETGWRKHIAKLTMEETPEWSALVKNSRNSDHQFSQRDFLDFMKDWAHVLTFKDKDGNDVNTTRVYQAVQKLEVKKTDKSMHEEGDFRAARSKLEELDIKGAEQSLPEAMTMTCPTHIGLFTTTAECRLMVLTNGEKVAIGYRINALDKILDESAIDFAGQLREGFHGTEGIGRLPIWMGSFSR